MKNEGIKSKKGITLVALVVTIVVLIILAGITLTLVLGQNGIVNKAKEARDKTQADQLNTELGMNSLYDEMKGAISETTDLSKVNTVKDAKEKNATPIADNKALTDDNSNIITVPAGFKIATDSPTKQEQGIVVEDKDGNQYVWVPVANISNYTRTDFGKEGGAAYSNYSETMPNDEQTSINAYKGYYIGRYEAGDVTSTTSKMLRASGASVTNKVSIKNEQAPYNYVTRDQANTLATGITAIEGYKATTKLCSSYAWDTAINFIQQTVANYGTSSNQGNYEDTTFSYTDITGASQTKGASSSVITPTGETTPVCSIYDMGGNDWEWTTEACNFGTGCPYVYRGGSCGSDYASSAAGSRTYNSATYSTSYVALRVTLYM